MNKSTCFIFILLLFNSCNQRGKNNSTDHNPFFKVPVIIQSPTEATIEFFNPGFVEQTWPRYLGKYKFTDTLKLSQNLETADTSGWKDKLWKSSLFNNTDSFQTDGFQIVADYEATLYYIYRGFQSKGNYYYPVYAVNETSHTKIFIAKDSYVFALQEACDTNNYDRWEPIEGRGFDFCGSGYFGLKVHPGEFVLFLVPKYQGPEKTLMRVRLQLGDNIYTSNSFQGKMSYNQFSIKKDSGFYEELKKNKASAIQWIFYGSIPKDFD
ncbi:MAG TPA: hypothetical protein VIZ28_18160 [Chitinophagaceae bacterium]